MNSLVSCQVALGGEPFAANRTLERPLLGVGSLVENRLAFRRKYFGAEAALDQGAGGDDVGGDQLSVHVDLMRGKLRRLGESLLTLATLVRLAVGVLVVDQVGSEPKGFLAN